MAGREIRRLAGVEQNRAGVAELQDLLDIEQRWGGFVEQRAQLAVSLRVELEVVRPRRLALGHRGHEFVLPHVLERVVRPALLAQRRTGLVRQLLTAG